MDGVRSRGIRSVPNGKGASRTTEAFEVGGTIGVTIEVRNSKVSSVGIELAKRGAAFFIRCSKAGETTRGIEREAQAGDVEVNRIDFRAKVDGRSADKGSLASGVDAVDGSSNCVEAAAGVAVGTGRAGTKDGIGDSGQTFEASGDIGIVGIGAEVTSSGVKVDIQTDEDFVALDNSFQSHVAEAAKASGSSDEFSTGDRGSTCDKACAIRDELFGLEAITSSDAGVPNFNAVEKTFDTEGADKLTEVLG